ncbi:hypothetical protein BY996DRAFT_1274162 [Phakopsora pachyrhizi]|uniref:Expressed protein n=1 Tax=Phakopsora pachyrhizi TaxID=170000 RepID=A0AAV0BHN6_PHAPC|nr:hypothetical protein BY996DRAFT_1274162 [Phakopsora pachyrhizi]CAH7686730.1 expressed protein [Phakopsora pachyrhizi]
MCLNIALLALCFICLLQQATSFPTQHNSIKRKSIIVSRQSGTSRNLGSNNSSVSQENSNAQFSVPVKIPGGNSRAVFQYRDGLILDTISFNPHSLSVATNLNPANSAFVTAADPSRNILGGKWAPLTKYSYNISFQNEIPDDMIVKISVPYKASEFPKQLDGNVYIGVFEPKRGGWVIDVDRTENRRDAQRVDLVGLASPTGEYRLLGHVASPPLNESNYILNFGNSDTGVFEVLAPIKGILPPPLQVGTWQDGSRIMIRSTEPMQIRMEIANITISSIPFGYQPATRYGLIITSNSQKSKATVSTNLQIQYISSQLRAKEINPDELVVAGRPLRSSNEYQVLSATAVSGNGALMVTPMTMVDGEYVLLGLTKFSRRQKQLVLGTTNSDASIQARSLLNRYTGQLSDLNIRENEYELESADNSKPVVAANVGVPRGNASGKSFFGSVETSSLPIQKIGGSSNRITAEQNDEIKDRIKKEIISDSEESFDPIITKNHSTVHFSSSDMEDFRSENDILDNLYKKLPSLSTIFGSESKNRGRNASFDDENANRNLQHLDELEKNNNKALIEATKQQII